jgi:hypothetical protein
VPRAREQSRRVSTRQQKYWENRLKSTRKTEASRSNGKKSHGPVTDAGKRRIRLNALADGLFSQEMVIPSTGESEKEFQRLSSAILDYFRPTDIVTEMLVRELISLYWRMQRPRRCEAAEIRRQLQSAELRNDLDKIARNDFLKNQFLRDYAAKTCIAGKNPELAAELTRSLDETRRALKQTSLGLEFLINKVDAVKQTLDR